MKARNNDSAQALFERVFKTKKDQNLVISFAEFLQELTELDVSFCLGQQATIGMDIVWAAYAVRDNEQELFVFTHFNAKSIVTTLKIINEIIGQAASQSDVNDLTSMMLSIESHIEPGLACQYIIQQLREILIFSGRNNPAMIKRFFDTKAYFEGQYNGAPDGVTLH